MLPVVSSALCLLCSALLFSVFSPPLKVHYSLSLLVAWTPLKNPVSSTVSVHGFSHSILVHVRFLSRLRRFFFCLRAWSSLFSVSMNAWEVATCPHWNSTSLLVNSFLWLCRGYVLSPPWRLNGFQIPLDHGLIPVNFASFYRAKSQPSDLGSSRSNVIHTSSVANLLDR